MSSHATCYPLGVRAVVGQARSADGVHWQPAAPASAHAAPVAEVSGYCRFGDRHYVFVSIGEGMGPRFDRFSEGRQGSGMWYWCSERADGPYAAPEHDSLLQGSRSGEHSAYFGTAFRLGERWLWNHHWGDNEGNLWLAPLKELVEVAPWRLTLNYWPGNDALRGDLCLSAVDGQRVRYPQPVPGRPLCADWQVDPQAMAGSTEAAGLAVLDIPEVAASGCMLTADLVIERNAGDGAGLFIGGSHEKPADGIVLLLHPRGALCWVEA